METSKSLCAHTHGLCHISDVPPSENKTLSLTVVPLCVDRGKGLFAKPSVSSISVSH